MEELVQEITQHLFFLQVRLCFTYPLLSLCHPEGMGDLRIFFFFTFVGKKNLSPASWLFFIREKNGRMIRHYCRPATHPNLIGISRFFSTNLEVSRFSDSTCENPRFLFCFEIGKTKRRLTLSHVTCLQAHKAWAKNKFYDWLNWRPWLNPLYTATQRVR